jgi:hypothetical protein
LDASGGSVCAKGQGQSAKGKEFAPPRQLNRYVAPVVLMREQVLKDFFAGNLSAKELAVDLEGSMVTSGTMTRHPIENMSEGFQIWPEHLTLVCDAILRGDIDPKYLHAIGFCIVASDNFEYDTDTTEGDLVADTVIDWSSPEANYPLTLDNVRKFRERLVTGNDPFTLADAT